MSKIAFKEMKFRADSLAMIEECNSIIDEYQEQDLRLTLRQLYYQLVSRDIVPNVERSYRNLSSLVTNARLAGLMDWSAIEDRVRQPRRASEWDSIQDLVEGAISAFRLPRWNGQKCYAELWVEKDALAGVLEPLAYDHHVTLMVNRGYSSASAMYDSANRFKYYGRGKECHLFYLGDHDPSGEDMVRDIRDRLEMFRARVDVEKIALTMNQIEEFKPPPNPAKLSDPRAEGYIEKYGDESWEVDALPPDVLAKIVTAAFDGVLDREMMAEVVEKEEELKEKLKEVASDL